MSLAGLRQARAGSDQDYEQYQAPHRKAAECDELRLDFVFLDD
jgi:hypothetical protein